MELLFAIAPFIWVYFAERQYRKDREKDPAIEIIIQCPPHPVFGFRVQRFRVQRLTVEPAEP